MRRGPKGRGCGVDSSETSAGTSVGDQEFLKLGPGLPIAIQIMSCVLLNLSVHSALFLVVCKQKKKKTDKEMNKRKRIR